jgi:hypothetical protein
MAPVSQELEPPANPGRFTDALDRAVDLEYRIRYGDQFANQRDAFKRGLLNFLGANQVPARMIRGAPFVSDDETARWRSSYPISLASAKAQEPVQR